MAEQSGLIRLLSEWIINTACRELATLQQVRPGLRMGINLSMHNLHDYKLTGVIEKALARYRLEPASLLLEITETGVMLDPNQVIEILNQLSSIRITSYNVCYTKLLRPIYIPSWSCPCRGRRR